jgi:hypothetical protein
LECSQAIQQKINKESFADELFPPSNKQDCVQQLRKARKELKRIKQNIFKRREEELKQKIQALEASTREADQEQARRIRRIKEAEEIKRLFEILSRSRATPICQVVTSLEIPIHPHNDPKNCTEWQIIDVPATRHCCAITKAEPKAFRGSTRVTVYSATSLKPAS